MMQDIYPKVLKNDFKLKQPQETDFVLYFEEKLVYLNGNGQLPKVADYNNKDDFYYLFSIDDESFFLANHKCNDLTPFNLGKIRFYDDKNLSFDINMGASIYRFIQNNRYCGKCGDIMVKSTTERAVVCPGCHNVVYPKISPAVIVGIIDKDKILCTKYAGRDYTSYALVAGFSEVGETIEETVKREVLEEVGLLVKNIKFYKSQPWVITDSLLMGFFCELDGDNTITLQESELSEASWIKRSEMWDDKFGYSLTGEMMEQFKKGEY